MGSAQMAVESSLGRQPVSATPPQRAAPLECGQVHLRYVCKVVIHTMLIHGCRPWPSRERINNNGGRDDGCPTSERAAASGAAKRRAARRTPRSARPRGCSRMTRTRARPAGRQRLTITHHRDVALGPPTGSTPQKTRRNVSRREGDGKKSQTTRNNSPFGRTRKAALQCSRSLLTKSLSIATACGQIHRSKFSRRTPGTHVQELGCSSICVHRMANSATLASAPQC